MVRMNHIQGEHIRGKWTIEKTLPDLSGGDFLSWYKHYERKGYGEMNIHKEKSESA